MISIPFYIYPTFIEAIVSIEKEIQVQVKCEKSTESEIFLAIIDSIFYCFVPFIITLLFSILTLAKLFRITRSNKTPLKNDTRNIFNSKLKSDNILELKFFINKNDFDNSTITIKKSSSLICMEPEFMIKRYLTKRRSLPIRFDQYKYEVECPSIRRRVFSNFKTNIRMNSKKFKITFMLMIFPLSFLFCFSPVFGILFLKTLNINPKHNYEIEFTIAKIFMYLNNSINIFLLLICSRSFRNGIFKNILSHSVTAE